MAVTINTSQVQKGITREMAEMKRKALAGVVAASMHVKGKSMDLVPVALGNLRNSAFVVWFGGSNDSPSFSGEDAGEMSSNHGGVKQEMSSHVRGGIYPQATVGYSAVYALAVHENPRAGAGKDVSSITAKKGKGLTQSEKNVATKGQWKFLAQPLKTEKEKMLAIMAERARV